MKKLIASMSLLCLCLMGFGCATETDAADTDEPGVLGSALEGDAASLGANADQLLALGDSIAFGYNPFGNFNKVKTFQGYPESLSGEFGVTNASCPGESSGSFLSATAPDNGCRAYKAAYPLHVFYDGAPTQMAYALNRINAPKERDRPDLITLNISGNDIFLLQAQCATQPDPAACFSAGAPALIGQIAQNVGTILGTIRGAGYTGPITYMNLYSATTDQSSLGFVGALNSNVEPVARMFGAKIANAFGAFLAASGTQSPCDAGLLIRKPSPDTGCDVHPSPEGDEVLAQSVRDAS
jgi:lysophospholipase L1-like esterase